MVFSREETFPVMIDKPETRTTVSAIVYWFFGFIVLPLFIHIVCSDAGLELYGDWLDLGYHLFNFLAAIMLFLPYLSDSFLTVQIQPGQFWKTVCFCAVAVIMLKIAEFGLAVFLQNGYYAQTVFGSLLTTESDLVYFSTSLIYEQPIWGTLCLVLLTPLTTSCLLYACIFAPICNSRPWLAYLVLAIAFFVVRLLMAFCFWPFKEELAIFLVQLPIHFIACWAYQQTDTVWAPVAVHTISNLLLAPLAMFNMGIF